MLTFIELVYDMGHFGESHFKVEMNIHSCTSSVMWKMFLLFRIDFRINFNSY